MILRRWVQAFKEQADQDRPASRLAAKGEDSRMSMTTLKMCLMAGAIAAFAAPTVALAQAPSGSIAINTKRAPYSPPRTLDGRASLEGTWSNASITRLERNTEHGKGLILTPEEAAKIEGGVAAITELSNRPTDPNATVKDLPADCSG